MKSYTDIEQSRKLTDILPLESADMEYLHLKETHVPISSVPFIKERSEVENSAYDATYEVIPCWSLAALLKYLNGICPQVYTPILFPSEGKWILQFTEYGHGNMCEVSYDNPIDACYELIIKLHELNLL